jgi:dihydrofolate reductase
MKISIIVAIAKNGAIGFENKLLYWLPNDLKRFKALTTGHTIIMGRKTFESHPRGALPNRRNIVLTRQDIEFPGAERYSSLEAALEQCRHEEEVFIIGGASVYQEALPLADKLCITHIEDTPSEADAFFPEIDPSVWNETSREVHLTDEKHLYPYQFVDYERIK